VAQPDTASAPRRAPRGWLVVGLGAGVLAIVAASFFVLRGPRDPGPAPEDPSGSPAWLLLLFGLAIGVVIGVAVARRRRPPRVSAATAANRLHAAQTTPPRLRPTALASRATVFIESWLSAVM
jgi:hypothetical protein